MYSYLCFVLSLVVFSDCVTIHRHQDEDIVSKSRIEVTPFLIKCILNDIVIFSAPNLNKETLYYLHKPNGDVLKLDIPKYEKTKKIDNYEHIKVRYINDDIRMISPEDNYEVFNPNERGQLLEDYEKQMGAFDIVLGPLSVQDHGNWVLSMYVKDIDDQYIEMFQVITVEIIETVPLLPRGKVIKAGDTLHISFAYPVHNLTSCELRAPVTTFDRFYDRNHFKLDKCGYIVNKMTKSDTGIWKIIGVGDIVYTGEAFMRVV